MNKKIATISLKGKDYATVPTRIKEFRQDNPNGLIETKPEILEEGQVLFTARILKNKADQNSAESTGHAIGNLKEDKAFEKLETIAVGRALAMLGYMASGDIASDEEMKRYFGEKFEKFCKEVDKIKTLESLRTFYKDNKGKGKEYDEYITNKSKELKNENS